MSKEISNKSMVSLFVAAGLLVISIFLPWWGMRFFAPQYPNGLNIIVYPYKLEGEIDIVNSLNHYIGMARFSEENFPELQFMPWVIGGFALLIVIVALLRKMSLLYGLIGLFIIGGILGLYDLRRWLVTFGTELDPRAPITIDPFVPPIIGENTIANFVTHSYFSFGSYLLAVAFLLLLFPLWKERRK
ncbi:hypothetical protein LGQ02_04505 [Bacillus shivajii]|uniref:hypothetical protein n=1 Tax=Bacillus shivajii TaxID=1983719 RepID=UPI001CFA1151|nr:hypothetical protein [Bacillus shivajii]UCZ54049.1 hypothetical protein LGQ02_04505 [Bacillus shivajii]